MSFVDRFSEQSVTDRVLGMERVSVSDVRRVLARSKKRIEDLPVLLSKPGAECLEDMAQQSRALSLRRFGHTMQLFAPLYLSNECYNSCTYCGFSMEHDYPRVTLSDEQILEEGRILREKGFQHVLLLTGEAPGPVGTDYIAHAARLLKPLFVSIGIEVQPLSLEDYRVIREAGVDSLTLYQETYHRESYLAVHKAGKKRNYDHRLTCQDNGGEAAFYRMNLGVLLGLYDWRFDCLALADHVAYMQRRYWKTKFSVSFPRIKEMFGEFNPGFSISDRDMVQIICAFRLVFPDVGITLSTREPAEFRDHLLKLGVTTMSAESHTEPGGYSGTDAEGQFSISDSRSLPSVNAVLANFGYEPVMRDWVPV